MKVLMIGSGQMLYFLSRNFAAKGYYVVIINRDRQECVRLARRVTATVICGDGSDAEVLSEAGARGADVVLAITSNDQDNLIICQLATLSFGVPKAIALANDTENVEVFEALGVRAFSTTHIIGSLIEQHASLEQIRNLLPVGEGRVNVTEIILDESCPVAGKYLKDVSMPENSLVAVMIRDNKPIVPRGSSSLKVGDQIVLITLPENHGPVLKLFTRQEK